MQFISHLLRYSNYSMGIFIVTYITPVRIVLVGAHLNIDVLH